MNGRNNGYGIPHTFGAGLTFTHKQKLTIGADYTLQQWSKAKYNNTEVYHIGASLKDLGKKMFAFSKLELPAHTIISDGEKVQIKEREKNKLNWDDKLTFEFHGVTY